MSVRRLLAFFLVAFGFHGFCTAGPSHAEAAWTGVVTHVSDGDTLWVRPPRGGAPRKIRLDGIDAPEICQRHGEASAKALAQRVLHRPVRVMTRGIDDYERALARLSLQGEDVGGWMVAHGHAWSYRYRRSAGPYASQESQARRARRGLFADAQALRPREFRQRHGSCGAAP
ncbi:MAG TPA: thermonuclease family protein [Burkholderiaceae bacterium]|nr:thermonuclease family protein [Burkholderiaceae bacterium]